MTPFAEGRAVVLRGQERAGSSEERTHRCNAAPAGCGELREIDAMPHPQGAAS